MDNLDDLFEGCERQAPEPALAPDDGALAVQNDLFPPSTSTKRVPFDAAGLTVDVGDFFGPRPEPLDGSALAMEDLSNVFERPPAPKPGVSVTSWEAVDLDEPPAIEEPPAAEALPEQGAPFESSVLVLAAGLRQLAAELRDLSADPF